MEKDLTATPAVSVIVPIYNVAPYLSACLDSILAQTFQAFELILVDDGSTDGSREIAEAYAGKDARIRFARHRWNRGASQAYALGMELSRGKYIAFVDGDDAVASNYLETLYSVAESTEADVVQGAYQIFHNTTGDGTVVQGFKTLTRLKDTIQDRIEFFFHGRVHLAPWCKMLRHSFLDAQRIMFFDMPVAMDVSFHFECLLTASRYIVLPDVLYYYRQRPGSQVTVNGLKRVQQYSVAMARSVDGIVGWVRSNPMFQDVQNQRQICAVLYLFFRWKLRELIPSLGEKAVFETCHKMLEGEPQKALHDVALYAELMNL